MDAKLLPQWGKEVSLTCTSQNLFAFIVKNNFE